MAPCTVRFVTEKPGQLDGRRGEKEIPSPSISSPERPSTNARIARAETITEKPSFRNPFRGKRCLVPATGFYEWQRTTDKTPYYIGLKSREPFCFAGLWDQWVSPDGEIIRSFTIITTAPNELMAAIHDRMPVILHRDDEQRWLNPKADPSLADLLEPFPAGLMVAWPVSKLVNSPANDTAVVMAPALEDHPDKLTGQEG